MHDEGVFEIILSAGATRATSSTQVCGVMLEVRAFESLLEQEHYQRLLDIESAVLAAADPRHSEAALRVLGALDGGRDDLHSDPDPASRASDAHSAALTFRPVEEWMRVIEAALAGAKMVKASQLGFEDIAREVMLHLAQRGAGARRILPVEELVRIARTAGRNRAFDVLKKMKREAARNLKSLELVRPQPSIDERIDFYANALRMVNAADGLSHEDRTLIFADLVNLEDALLASWLGIKQNTCLQRRIRARAKLADKFGAGNISPVKPEKAIRIFSGSATALAKLGLANMGGACD